MATLFDLRTLMSACVYVARRGGRIIRDVHRTGSLAAHNKRRAGDDRPISEMKANEVLTVADCRAQDAIVTSLRNMFPTLRIVGEEGEVQQEEPPSALDEVPLLEVFVVPPALRDALSAADTCLWIDPLDGTKEFVLGNLENVSVLIGICVKDRPVAGVLFKPFLGGESGSLTYGALGVGVFGDKPVATACEPDDIIVVMSPSSFKFPRIRAGLAHMKPRPKIEIADATGNKLLRLIHGEAHVVLMGPGPSRWDTCAGEALLMALGGHATDLDGNAYKYIENGIYGNLQGFIAASTPQLHRRFLEALVEPPTEPT